MPFNLNIFGKKAVGKEEWRSWNKIHKELSELDTDLITMGTTDLTAGEIGVLFEMKGLANVVIEILPLDTRYHIWHQIYNNAGTPARTQAYDIIFVLKSALSGMIKTKGRFSAERLRPHVPFSGATPEEVYRDDRTKVKFPEKITLERDDILEVQAYCRDASGLDVDGTNHRYLIECDLYEKPIE